ncbi:MAG: hypothetical protein ACTHJW_01005 [Streptosporangiaceae bacterium]
MLKRAVKLVVLLGVLGMFAGVVYAYVFRPTYEVGEAIRFVPAHVCGHQKSSLVRCAPASSTVRHLAAVTESQHRGVQIIVARDGHSVDISATGSIPGADRAVGSAARDLIARIHIGEVRYLYGVSLRFLSLGNAISFSMLGLLAGLSAALGFLVPPRSRLASARGT